MSCLRPRTASQVSSFGLWKPYSLPPALKGQALGPPSFPIFSTVYSPSQLAVMIPNRTQLRPSLYLCSVRLGVMRLEALQGTGEGVTCEAKNDLILTVLEFSLLDSCDIVFSKAPLSQLQMPCFWSLLWLSWLRPGLSICLLPRIVSSFAWLQQLPLQEKPTIQYPHIASPFMC